MRPYLLNLMTGGAGALLVSAAARALPQPADGGGRFYAWLYQFVHILLANFDKARLDKVWVGHDGQPGSL